MKVFESATPTDGAGGYCSPRNQQNTESTAKSKGTQTTSERVQEMSKAARERSRQSLLADRQLTGWADATRGAPNEILRSSLFTARNRNQARHNLKQAVVGLVGKGEMIYTGEELRQDDETVWFQLIHLAREKGLDTPFQFTPYSFCRSLNWPLTGQSYDHLEKCMTRLQATSLKISFQRLGTEISLSMLPIFQAKRRKAGDGGLWTVQMHGQLVFLFSEFQYTRVDWQQRLTLPEGLATWLHAYYASHGAPYDLKVETLAVGAGLMLKIHTDPTQMAKHKERLRDVKKLIVKALSALKGVGFLTDFKVKREGLVVVRRAGGGDLRGPIP